MNRKQISILSPVCFYVAALLNLAMMVRMWLAGAIGPQLVFNAVAAAVFLLCGSLQLASWYRRRQRRRRRMEARRSAQ